MRENVLKPVEETWLIKLYDYFLWCLSFFCLALGVFSWIRLVGIFPGDLWRFDLMPERWKVLTVFLAIVYPVASCGLWMRSRWGIVLWLIAGTTESIALTINSADYAFFPKIALLHGLFLVVFIVLRVLIFIQNRNEAKSETRYS